MASRRDIEPALTAHRVFVAPSGYPRSVTCTGTPGQRKGAQRPHEQIAEGEHQVAGSLRDPNVLAAIQAARIPPAGTSGPYASPADWRGGWIYFLMVDRFNNPDHLPVHQPYDEPNYFKYQGGTFRGVRAQLQPSGPGNVGAGLRHD
jgi:hypothetical protein